MIFKRNPTKKKIGINRIQLLCSVLSGMMTSMAFSFPFLDWLAWISLIPFFYGLFAYEINGKTGFFLSFIYAFTFYLGLLWWIYKLHPLTWVGFSEKESLLVVTAGWICFSLIEAIGLSFSGLALGIVKPQGWKRVLFIAFIWITIEWVQGLGMFGFTWGRLGISQYRNLYLIQSANLFGSLFISGILVFVNAALASFAVASVKFKKFTNFKYIALGCSVFVLNFSYGIWGNIKKVEAPRSVPIAIIQGNVAQDAKWKPGTAEKILKNYLDLSYEATKDGKAKIVVWPETAVPVSLSKSSKMMAEYEKLAKDRGVYFVTGAFHTVNENTYNAIFTLDPEGQSGKPYYKRHLVPFGEYFPFKSLLKLLMPKLEQINLLKSDISPGKNTEIIQTSYGNIGGLVCFESIIPELARESVQDGAKALVIVTNDSWYKDSIALSQHNAQAVMRAVENNRYVIRAANTGISSVISPKGEIIKELGPLKRGYIKGEVSFLEKKTVYTRIGDVIVPVSLLGMISIAAWTGTKRKRLGREGDSLQ
ncbi:MAG: apolipoprotein N-acyltransferase [Clostridia bacterium]|nr:apolipoprotein N-acyltransferase [Clostridia bacterium]